jgi:hypothetical protein
MAPPCLAPHPDSNSLFGWAATGWAGPAAGNQRPQPSTAKPVKPAIFKFKHKGKKQVPFFSSFGAKPISILMKLTT